MNSIALNDLSLSNELDRAAMAAIKGGSEWHLRSTYVDAGTWSGYTLMSKSYVGQTFHDGYLSKQTNEGWKRTRTQTEYSYWDHFVRV